MNIRKPLLYYRNALSLIQLKCSLEQGVQQPLNTKNKKKNALSNVKSKLYTQNLNQELGFHPYTTVHKASHGPSFIAGSLSNCYNGEMFVTLGIGIGFQ